MSKVEQLRNRLMKLQNQFLEEEVKELIGSTRSLVLRDGIVKDYPLIMCPACQEETQAVEGQLDREYQSWIYFDTECSSQSFEFVPREHAIGL